MTQTISYIEQFGERFQTHLLSVLARTPGMVPRYRTALSEKFFASALESSVAKALFKIIDEHKILPTRSTLEEEVRAVVSKETMPAVDKLLDKVFADDVSDAAAVMAKAIEFGQTQALCLAVIESTELMESGKKDKIKGVFDKAYQVGQDLTSIGINYRANLPIRASTLEVDEQIDTIPTGIQHLDHVLKGGLGRGELGVVIAPPGKGKTTTLINFGFGGLRNPARYRIAHYSLEMPEAKVTRRYDDRLMGDYTRLKGVDQETYARVLTERGRQFVFGELVVKGYATRKATISGLRTHLAILASQNLAPDCVIVDYADILKPERRLGEMRHEQAGLYEDLRELAGEFNFACWTASQATKSALDKKTITIADFAESFEKAAVVDVAIGFCQADDEKVNRKCRLFAAKIRGHEDGQTIECTIMRDRCYIRSDALYDAGNNEINIAGQVDETVPQAAEIKAVVAAAGSLRDRVKAEAGIGGPKKRTSGPSSAPKLGTGNIADLGLGSPAKPKPGGPGTGGPKKRSDGPQRKVAP